MLPDGDIVVCPDPLNQAVPNSKKISVCQVAVASGEVVCMRPVTDPRLSWLLGGDMLNRGISNDAEIAEAFAPGRILNQLLSPPDENASAEEQKLVEYIKQLYGPAFAGVGGWIYT